MALWAFLHWSAHRSLCLPPFYGAVHGDSTIIGIDVRPFQTANLSDTQASGQTDIDAEVAECEVLFDEIEDLSLLATWRVKFHLPTDIRKALTQFQEKTSNIGSQLILQIHFTELAWQ